MNYLLRVFLILGLTVSAFADISCSNGSGYKVNISNTKTADIVTPYETVSIDDISGGGNYFFGNINSSGIKSFSLSVKGDDSRLIIIRKNSTVTMDRQELSCQGTAR